MGQRWGLVAPSQAPGVGAMPRPPLSRVLGLAAPVGRRWPAEMVRHSRLSSEHFPRPTHDIRNIIRQCQPAPRGPQPPRYPPGSQPSRGLLLRACVPVLMPGVQAMLGCRRCWDAMMLGCG